MKKKIQWNDLATKHGYPDPLTMITDLRKKLGSIKATAKYLGMTAYPVSIFLSNSIVGAVKKNCKFCNDEFTCKHLGNNRTICFNQECIDKQAQKTAEDKRRWRLKKYKENKSYRLQNKQGKPTGRKCIECGGIVNAPNMFRCDDCLNRLRSCSTDYIDAYGEQVGAYI